MPSLFRQEFKINCWERGQFIKDSSSAIFLDFQLLETKSEVISVFD